MTATKMIMMTNAPILDMDETGITTAVMITYLVVLTVAMIMSIMITANTSTTAMVTLDVMTTTMNAALANDEQHPRVAGYCGTGTIN